MTRAYNHELFERHQRFWLTWLKRKMANQTWETMKNVKNRGICWHVFCNQCWNIFAELIRIQIGLCMSAGLCNHLPWTFWMQCLWLGFQVKVVIRMPAKQEATWSNTHRKQMPIKWGDSFEKLLLVCSKKFKSTKGIWNAGICRFEPVISQV